MKLSQLAKDYRSVLSTGKHIEDRQFRTKARREAELFACLVRMAVSACLLFVAYGMYIYTH